MQGPTLFDAFFTEAAEAKEAAIASTVREIRKEAEIRRTSAGKKPERPGRYLYAGLPEEWRTEYLQDVDLTRYDIIGRDVERILHRSPARVWVECVERPVLRKKGESKAPSPVCRLSPPSRCLAEDMWGPTSWPERLSTSLSTIFPNTVR